jgi:hypothetical protein
MYESVAIHRYGMSVERLETATKHDLRHTIEIFPKIKSNYQSTMAVVIVKQRGVELYFISKTDGMLKILHLKQSPIM